MFSMQGCIFFVCIYTKGLNNLTIRALLAPRDTLFFYTIFAQGQMELRGHPVTHYFLLYFCSTSIGASLAPRDALFLDTIFAQGQF